MVASRPGLTGRYERISTPSAGTPHLTIAPTTDVIDCISAQFMMKPK
jgi:hypothetical protein